MSSICTGSVISSDSDSDDTGALEALGRKFAKEWDPEGLITHKISALTLKEQLAYKSKIEVEENIDKKFESLQHEESQHVMKAQSEHVISVMKSSFKFTNKEMGVIPNSKPGRETIIFKWSGSLFSAGTKVGIERLLNEKKYCKGFETIMRDQLTQNVETINVNSLICNCAKFRSEEKHCLAKYLLFAMSVCKKELLVDAIYNSLLDFRNSWTHCLDDYLDVFNNWGIPKELLYPPFIFNQDTCSTTCSPDCNFEVADYNVFKVMEYVNEMFDGKVHSDFESTMTIVRVLMMMWLDKRFTVSWGCAKFGSSLTRLVDGIDTNVGSPEIVVCRILDFSVEHMHNQAWIITKFLESKTASTRLVGRLVATQFLLRAFDCDAIPHRGLDLHELHTLLVSESPVLAQRELYSVHVILLIVDSYITSYHTTEEDQDIIEALVQWAHNIQLFYSDDSNSAILDRQIIVSQMKTLDIKLKCSLEDYFIPEEWEGHYMNRPSICSGDTVKVAMAKDPGRHPREGVSDHVSEDPSTVGRMDIVSDHVSEEQSTAGRIDVVSDHVSEERGSLPPHYEETSKAPS